MTNYEAERRLCLFGIPARSEGSEKVREILARILAEGSLSLSDLQTARDVVEHDGLKTPESYLFLAAMELALRAGNTYLRRGSELLKQAGCADGQIEPAFGAAVDECWARGAETVGAALAKGDGQLVVCKDVGAGEKGWFFAKVWNSVCVVSERLRALANKEDLLGLTDEAVQRAVLFKGKGGPFALNGEQQQAAHAVDDAPGPGAASQSSPADPAPARRLSSVRFCGRCWNAVTLRAKTLPSSRRRDAPPSA